MDDTTVLVIFCFSAENGEFVCQAPKVYQFNHRAAIIRPASAAKDDVHTENKQESKWNSRHCTAG